MYQASDDFHTAVAEGKPQIAMMLFSNAVFTNEDIRVDSGVELHDYFNTEEDLSIGQTLSNELIFTLFNDDFILRDYEFGEFLATIGVQTATAAHTFTGNVYATSPSNHTYIGLNSSPYLTRDGSALGTAPTKAIKCIMIYNGIVYCFGDDNYFIAYRDADGAKRNITVPDFMKRKGGRQAGVGAMYNATSRIMKLWRGGQEETYEFVPLGIFQADRPNVPTVIELNFTCYDRMQRLDKDMPTANELGVGYPITISGLYTAMCTYAGVPYRTGTFINSTATIAEEPEAFETATMRTVLGWIAEAAGSNARIDRDGYMILDWLKSVDLVLDENNYSEFNPYWYTAGTVTKIVNRDTQGSADTHAGEGTNAYLIQDNPLLKGVD